MGRVPAPEVGHHPRDPEADPLRDEELNGRARELAEQLLADDPELLQRDTPMPVQEARNGLRIKADCVYVIPPNRNLATIDSHLHLASLEEERRARAPMATSDGNR